ncbi:efflux RND transporter periplasmic adaptor subunit [Hymenobacter lutimineralis]|uniref:Efflux RND transporter periplasmic adaptor subunit n=1 Tax=Hymenobacter lutimineralis TaxID=2606448 RepID=A0A5D6UW16_9BACT|nr:efflux RND transporter periplasmic adaptor subunit [Hymenobacter lutimineralis]TYZ07217.1 efflux RND transporter periplasmic adaptor subunit [Hymenobacter lutimineralis]
MNSFLRLPLRFVVHRLPAFLLLAGLLAFVVSACQQAAPEQQSEAHDGTPTYFTCPMHPQIVRDKPGKCPICSMDLVKATKQAAAKPTVAIAPALTHYTCPMHPQISRKEPGKCPICGMDLVKASKAAPAAKATSGTTTSAPEVMLSAQQRQLAGIRVATFGPSGSAAGSTVLTGIITANANQTRTVSSRVAGRVERLFVRQTGEAIRAGAPLVSIYSEQLQALQQEYLLALAQQRAVGKSVNQYGRLVASARQKLRLLGLTEGQLHTLAATGRPTSSLTFYSPQAGLVQAVGVTEGQYVGEGSLLVSLTNLSSVWVEAQLYPDEVAGIEMGQSVQVQVSGRPDTYSGRVVFLSPELQANSKVTLLRVQVANPGGRLQPGMQANVRLTSWSTMAQSRTLPQDAVLRDSRGSYVWQQIDAGGHFRRLNVTTGAETDEAVAITGGLDAGALVVVNGAYLLESEYALYQGTDPMAGMDSNMPGMDMKKPAPAEKAPAMDPNMKM